MRGLVVLAGCGTGAGAPPPGPPPAAEVWDEGEGWGPAPRVPDGAPTPRWTAEVPVGATTALDDTGIVVVAVPQGATTRVDRLDVPTGRVLWSVPVPGVEARPTITGRASPAVVLEDQTSGGTVTVLDAADGRVLWAAPEDRGAVVDARPDVLLVRSFADTTAVDRATGAQRWRVPYDVSARPAGFVIATAGDVATQTKTHGIADPATGAARWTRQDPLFTDLEAVDGAVVYTADVEPGTDTVARQDVATGAPQWSVPVGDIGRAGVVSLDPRTLLVVGGGGPGMGTAAVSPADGRVLWRAPSALADAVRVNGRPLAVRLDRGRLDVADGRTGGIRHATVPESGSVRLVGAAVYATQGRDLVAVGLEDTQERWRVPEVGDVDDLRAVPGGFVAVVGRTEPRRLVGYQG